jgi:hypothetical protein
MRTAINVSSWPRAVVKTRSDLIVMPRGARIFASIRSPYPHTGQKSWCGFTAQRHFPEYQFSSPSNQLVKPQRDCRLHRPSLPAPLGALAVPRGRVPASTACRLCWRFAISGANSPLRRLDRLVRRIRRDTTPLSDRTLVLVANRLTAPGSEHGLARQLETDFVWDRHGHRWVPARRNDRERASARRPRLRVKMRQLKQWYRTLDQLLAHIAHRARALSDAARPGLITAGASPTIRRASALLGSRPLD